MNSKPKHTPIVALNGEQRTTAHASSAVPAGDAAPAAAPESSGAPGGVLADRFATLLEIMHRVDAARGQSAILHVLRDESRRVLQHDMCYVCLLDRTRSRYLLRVLGQADKDAMDGRVYPLSEGLAGFVIQNQTPVFSDLSNVQVAPGSVEEALVCVGAKSLLIVPLRTGADILGALAFASTRQFGYQEQDIIIAQHLATHVAIALFASGAFEDAQRRTTQLDLVRSATREMDTDPGAFLESSAKALRKALGASDVLVFLADRRMCELSLAAYSGGRGDIFTKGLRQPFTEGIAGWVAAHEEPAAVDDTAADPRCSARTSHTVRSEMAVPIRAKGEIIGVCNIHHARLQAFDDADVRAVEAFCDLLGVAMRTAQLRAEIDEANVRLTELDDAKSGFLSVISQNFQSPLSTMILAGSSLLKHASTSDPQRVSEYAKLIVDQASRLLELSEAILATPKTDSKTLACSFGDINMSRLIRDAAGSVEFPGHHVFKHHIEPGIKYVRGDMMRLRQVLQNLISNAVRYSPKGGLVEVHVRAVSTGMVQVSVSDEGIGIPRDQMNRLFQKFSWVEVPGTCVPHGAGLGLWFCREIVKAHGGEIWAASETGKGSTFMFTLPREQAGKRNA